MEIDGRLVRAYTANFEGETSGTLISFDVYGITPCAARNMGFMLLEDWRKLDDSRMQETWRILSLQPR